MYAKPMVSIVMAAYNAEKYIGVAIESVLNQTMTSWELIIVNDGSNDRTSDILTSYTDPRIIVKTQNNHGAASARNTGLKLVRGDFITFLDSDDFYEPSALDVQLKYITLHSNVGAVAGGYCRVSEDGKKILKANVYPDCQLIPITNFLFGNPSSLNGTLFRRESIDGFYFIGDLRVGEDWEFNSRVAFSGCNYLYHPKNLFYYRFNKTALVKTTEKYADAMVRVVDRIFKNIPIKSELYQLKTKAKFLVNLRMAARFFSIEQYSSGSFFLKRALNYKIDTDEQFYYNVSVSIAGWFTQFGAKCTDERLNKILIYFTDKIDKSRIKKNVFIHLDAYERIACKYQNLLQ